MVEIVEVCGITFKIPTFVGHVYLALFLQGQHEKSMIVTNMLSLSVGKIHSLFQMLFKTPFVTLLSRFSLNRKDRG